MLVKIKEQSNLSTEPLDGNNLIIRAYVNRTGLVQAFDVTAGNIIEIELYNFESVEDSLLIEVAPTSTFVIEPVTSIAGNITVTSEDGAINVHAYNVTEKSYVGGLPVLTSLSNVDGDAFILKQIEGESILGQVWNIGEVVKVSDSAIDNIVVEGGGGKILLDVTDYDPLEKQQLYNGVDTYLKTWRTDDEDTANYEKFVYYRVIVNENIFPDIPENLPVKIEYANKIGFLNFNVFIPLVEGLSVADIYKQNSSENLLLYLTDNSIQFNTLVDYSMVDFDFVTNLERDINWNKNFDKGFTLNDVLFMSDTFALKFIEIIEREFTTFWDEVKTQYSFVTDEQEFLHKQSVREEWLVRNNLMSVYTTMNVIIGTEVFSKNEDGNMHRLENETLFKLEFTYGWLVKNLTIDDINFFKSRSIFFRDSMNSYKTDLNESDMLGVINVFQTLEDVNKLNNITGYLSSTTNMNFSISTFAKVIGLMYLKQPFA